MALSLKARALRYLSAREHSRLELARKLAPYAQEGDDIAALLNDLEAAQFLSQQRFSESLIRRRAARFGNNRILAELKSHQIEADTVAALKPSLIQDETARALEVWRRKFGKEAFDARERAKQIQFLAQRGFSQKAIAAVLRFELED
jgi:regulatory protein